MSIRKQSGVANDNRWSIIHAWPQLHRGVQSKGIIPPTIMLIHIAFTHKTRFRAIVKSGKVKKMYIYSRLPRNVSGTQINFC